MPTETIGINAMIAIQYEPKRKNRWILEIDGLDAFTAFSAERPHVTFDETQMDYINVRWFIAGKATWAPMAIVLRDPIAPSAAQKVMQWIKLCYNAETGQAGYTAFYKKDIRLKLLGPTGEVVESWIMKGAWLQDINFDPLEYVSSDPVDIALTLRFDWPTLEW